MNGRTVNSKILKDYVQYLRKEEKSNATIEKYMRDIIAFSSYMNGEDLTKEKVLDYKHHLQDKGYAIRSINSMLASVNSLFGYLGWTDLRVKSLKVQKQVFCPEEKELTRAEYERLCRTALKKNNNRLSLILQTICSTGIRVSELPFITVEAVHSGQAEVTLKGKTRVILLLKDLQKKLLRYISEQKITQGSVFITRSGKVVDRTSIWREMKKLCKDADVDPGKVFPHNLRHLFARVFYGLKRDIVKLADILGHSSINTTRIYVISTGSEHRYYMEQMRLIL